jgi:hypothetical protein
MLRVSLDHVKLRGIQLFRKGADGCRVSAETLIAIRDPGHRTKVIRVPSKFQFDQVVKPRFEYIVVVACNRDDCLRGRQLRHQVSGLHPGRLIGGALLDPFDQTNGKFRCKDDETE